MTLAGAARALLVIAIWAVGTADSARGQTGTHPAVPPLHVTGVPDYAAELAGYAAFDVAVPLPPWRAPILGPLHHGSQLPVYAVGRSTLDAIPIPPAPRGTPPASVRGIYLNAWVFGSDRLESLIALADTTEINAFVIDVKDATGYLTFRSAVPTAVEIGANRMVRAPDIQQRLARLRDHGIHPIARIVVARDVLLATGKPEWAVKDRRGGLWRDGLGEPWVDAYHDSVWIYAADLAVEAVLMGFAEVQFDYIRFPDENASRMSNAVFPARRHNESRRAAVRRHVTMLRARVRATGVPFTLDVFGLTTSATGDLGIGQFWDDLSPLADALLPMVYPSHYGRGAYGIGFPNAEPYETVKRALEDGIRRSAPIANRAEIRPYLQSFSIRGVRYTATEVRAQIQAAEDLGITDWVLWNARGVYPAAAFRPKRSPNDRPVAEAGVTPDPEPSPRRDSRSR